MLALSIKSSHVRTEKLVRRADQKIAIQRLDVNQPVRRIVHSINKHERTRCVRKFCDFRDWIDRAHYVPGIANGDELRPRRDLSLQIVQVQRKSTRLNSSHT